MSFAFLALYTGDYRRDTQHLTPLKHGIYLLLLFHCWDTQGPAPLDEQELAGIANCRSADEIDALRYVVGRFFVRMGDGHYNKRMQQEIERASAISTCRANAGRRGANARMQRFRVAQTSAEQVLGKCLTSDATPTPTTTTTSTPTPKVKSVVAASGSPPPPRTASVEKKRPTRLPADWFLPDDWRDWAVRLYGMEPQRAVRISLDFRDFWHAKAGPDAVKLDWLATWRRWVRREMHDA